MEAIKVNLGYLWLIVFALYGLGQPTMLFAQPPGEAGQKIPEEVFQKVLRFTDVSLVSFIRKMRFAPWQEVYVFSGQNAKLIHVDAETKEVTFVIYDLPKMPVQQRISMEEAMERVKGWLAQRGISLEGWILKRQSSYKEGELNRYQFHWIKRSPEGVRLPCFLGVEIMDDGRISSFTRTERPVMISLKPKLSEEEAIKLALQTAEQGFKSKLSQFRVIEKELFVWFNHRNGEQELYWEILLEGEGKEEPYKHHNQTLVRINAHTGIVVATFW